MLMNPDILMFMNVPVIIVEEQSHLFYSAKIYCKPSKPSDQGSIFCTKCPISLLYENLILVVVKPGLVEI